MSDETLEILTNREMIAINQDSLGKQAFCFRDNGDYEIWVKKLAGDERAVCLLNRSDEKKIVEVDFSVLLAANDDYWKTSPGDLKNYSIRDVWEHQDIKQGKNFSLVEMPPHSTKVYRLIKNQK